MRFFINQVLASLILCLFGCGKPEVTYYEIPKEERTGPSSGKGSTRLPEGHPIPKETQPDSATPLSQPFWEVPDSWNPGPASPLRVASFMVNDTGGQTAEITITTFPGDVGGILLNINRWRRQIGLDSIPADEVSNYLTEVDFAENRFHLIDLHNTIESQGKPHPQNSLIAMLSHQDNTWFFKISGDTILVEKQRKPFLEFLETVKFQ
ncbi:MAG: hypothetical protein DF168_00264 [Candidatus Moanabacter tarae]|uniref:PsbP C-terminal domain-containing protein n=1 Tax=Candidatus Moanibacter tarae TaxID=2200854 RepID=A0A2Z4AGP2_9BACT|nr:MAG: hypothetical protein DF168_00264 [Candidatus Moanabacter tarae]|tara:strand:- start:2334 stop:2957 length:624 start_codon:yes stop_codon:yes gene_type:complete